MRFLQLVHSLVVGFEFIKLLFVFLYASVEARFQLGHLALKISDFAFVRLLELLLFRQQTLLVLLELL